VSPAHGAGLGPSSGEPARPAASKKAISYIHWLEQRSMLQQARVLSRHYSGNSIQWQHPYGQPQPHAAVARASVWFTAYPASTIPASPGTSARSHGAIVIGDVIPGHTGKGPDFRLAERAYADYPGLYHMVHIEPRDWGLLPPVPAGHDAVNLTPAAVDALQKKGYIVGQLHSG